MTRKRQIEQVRRPGPLLASLITIVQQHAKRPYGLIQVLGTSTFASLHMATHSGRRPHATYNAVSNLKLKVRFNGFKDEEKKSSAASSYNLSVRYLYGRLSGSNLRLSTPLTRSLLLRINMGQNLGDCPGSEFTKTGHSSCFKGFFRRLRWSSVGGIQIQGDNAVGLTRIGTRFSMSFLSGVDDNQRTLVLNTLGFIVFVTEEREPSLGAFRELVLERTRQWRGTA